MDCDVLLLFVNDIEKKCLFEMLQEVEGRGPSIYSEHNNTLTYHDCGNINGARVLALQTRMGSQTPGGTATVTMKAIQEVNPEYIVAVGVAFSMDTDKHELGQILLAEKVSCYDPRKETGKRKKITIRRGERVSVPEKVLGRFKALASAAYWNGVKVHYGELLSGEVLGDDPDFKKVLCKDYPEAIGGEMEAAGIYSANFLEKREWIVVKAVCDYADGNKAVDKEERQITAATNAARFVFHVLSAADFRRSGEANGQAVKLPSKQSKKTKKLVPQACQRSQPGDPIWDKVLTEITALLPTEHLKPFLDLLEVEIKESGTKTNLASADIPKILMEHELPAVLSWIRAAWSACKEKLRRGRKTSLCKPVWDDVVTMVGWRLLLEIDHEWAETNKASILSATGNSLRLSVKTGAVAEIVHARLRETKAQLCLREKKNEKEVVGMHSFPGGSLGSIEGGPTLKDGVVKIKKALWETVYRGSKSVPAVFDSAENDKLNRAIQFCHSSKEHYYFTVGIGCDNDPVQNPDVYETLCKDLPALRIIHVGVGDAPDILLLDEGELAEYLHLLFILEPKGD